MIRLVPLRVRMNWMLWGVVPMLMEAPVPSEVRAVPSMISSPAASFQIVEPVLLTSPGLVLQ